MFTFKPASKSASNGDGHKTEIGKTNGWLGFGSSQPRQSNGNGHASKIESVLGPGISYQGTLTGAGGIRIEGTFDGPINIQGTLVVADGARLTGDVQAGAVTVGGSVQGNITATKVEILSTGRVWGDLITTAFSTEEGAFLRGQVRMEDQVPVEVPAPAAVPIAAVQAAPAAVPASAEGPAEAVRQKSPALKPSTGWLR